MILEDKKDGNRMKMVRRVVVDGVEIFNFDTTLRLEYNMLDRLAADRAALKDVEVEYAEFSTKVLLRK